MGQAESTPQPAAWQPDFLTAHVKQASQQLSPVKAPLKGVSSIGPDSMSIAAAKNAEFCEGRAVPHTRSPISSGRRVSTSTATWGLHTVSYRTSRPRRWWRRIVRNRLRGQQWVRTPLIRKQREFAKQHEKGVRNQPAPRQGRRPGSALRQKGPRLPGGHQQLDSYENQFAADARKVTLGAENKFCRSPDVGKPTTIKGDAYYVEFAKTTHSWLAPKEKSHDEWRGIKANIPVQDFVKADKDAKKANIIENSKIQALPVPQVDSMSMMMRHAKQVRASRKRGTVDTVDTV